MRITVLIDNETRSALRSEWGLSFHIAYGGRTYLLDAGASGAFAENADALGLDLAAVDDAVLSHAHNDHADGLDTFFVRNAAAPCWLRASCAEDCYDRTDEGWSYAGPRPGLLAEWADRLRYVDGDVSLAPGVWLVPHKTPGLARIGERGRMFRKRPGGWVPDGFDHEQSLVFETEGGLVLFNSCSHGGADNIVREVAATFPGRPIRAILGGFHLFETPADEVRAFAERLRDTGVGTVVTGHCTGAAAYEILGEVLGDRLAPLYPGRVLDL